MDAETLNQLDAWRRKRTLSNRRGISTIRRTQTKWIQIQHKTFAKWVSQHSGIEVTNFKVDFIDGVVLLKLVEQLSGKRVKKSHLKPISISQRCDNIQLALDICKSEGVKLTNIGTQDIAEGSLKLMLGLVWCLIQRYHLILISQDSSAGSSKIESENVKAKVIRGLNGILDKMELRVSNLTSDWRDGMALTALVTHLAPMFNRDYMDIDKLYMKATEDAMEAAKEALKIPRLLSAEDFISTEVDELSMITYLSYFLDPAVLTVRDNYLSRHPHYVPAYRKYVESTSDADEEVDAQNLTPITGGSGERTPNITPLEFASHSNILRDEAGPADGDKKLPSPIKKLFSSYRSHISDIRLRGKKKPKDHYKEPYKVTGGPMKADQSILHRRKSHSKHSKYQCGNHGDHRCNHDNEIPSDDNDQETCKQCTEHLQPEPAPPKEDVMEIDGTQIEDSTSLSDGELSDQEKEDILQTILNATDDEASDYQHPLQSITEHGRPVRRSNSTAVHRTNNRMSKPTKKNNELQPFFRDHELFAEYKLLCNNVPSGVYVVPSFKCLQVWHGMIFIKIGMFADGCFKFNMYIPDDFPYSRPSLRFVTPVFHPQVKANGELNLAKAFPTWTPRKDRIWHVLRYTKRCFFSINTFDATNPDAADAVHKSIDTFRNKAKQCVENSIRLNMTEQEPVADDGNVFNVPPLPSEELKRIKTKITDGVKLPFGS